MKTLACLLVALGLCASLLAQSENAAPKLPQEELDKLAAPIALYPDSLVALILPASTTSSDVVLAVRFLANNGDQDAIDNQPWSASVKSLAHYPVIIQWMDENLAWTQQMGEVFAAQPVDVMNTIQRLRAQARAAGLLEDTPQQKVVMQDTHICIVPAEPDVIYVPYYDPAILWLRRPYSGRFITFGVGFGIGSWLYYDCDWPGRSIWVQRRHSGWVYHPGWRRPVNEVRVVVAEPWRPDFRRMHREHPVHPSISIAVQARGMASPQREIIWRNAHPALSHDHHPGPVVIPRHNRHSAMPTHPTIAPAPHFPVHFPPPESRDHPREHRERDNRFSHPTPRPSPHTPVIINQPLAQIQQPVVIPQTNGDARPNGAAHGLKHAPRSRHDEKLSDKKDNDDRKGRHKK